MSAITPPGLAKPKHHRPKQTVRGGYCVIRRGDSTHRLMTTPGRKHVYEHPSLESAMAEAARLAAEHNREFAVFQEVAAVKPPPAPQASDAVFCVMWEEGVRPTHYIRHPLVNPVSTLAAAQAEANRLTALHGQRYAVFRRIDAGTLVRVELEVGP